jgi:hypothetical protein
MLCSTIKGYPGGSDLSQEGSAAAQHGAAECNGNPVQRGNACIDKQGGSSGGGSGSGMLVHTERTTGVGAHGLHAHTGAEAEATHTPHHPQRALPPPTCLRTQAACSTNC